MLATLLICAVTLGSIENEAVSYDKNEEVTYSENESNKKGLWEYKRSIRIGYESHTFQNENGNTIPMSYGFGISRVRRIWLHKKPIGRTVKLSIDRGIDLNYGRFATQIAEDDGYNGPRGFVGSVSEDLDEGDTEAGGGLLGNLSLDALNLTPAAIGLNYVSIGYAIGGSLTINPAGKFNINTYCHFVPSLGLMVSGSSINAGYMPYVRSGAEFSLGRVGLGAEYVSGVSSMTDMLPVIMSKFENPDQKISTESALKQQYYSNFMKVYMVFHMGKRKK